MTVLTTQHLDKALTKALKNLATKDDVKEIISKHGFATKDDLKAMEARQDAKYATKADLHATEKRLTDKVGSAVSELKSELRVQQKYLDQAFDRVSDRILGEMDMQERVTRIEAQLGMASR